MTPSKGHPVRLARRVQRAHCAERFDWDRTVGLEVASTGPAFTAKGQHRALLDLVATIQPSTQRITVEGRRPRPWHVEIADSTELRARLAGLRAGRSRLAWTPEQAGVFAAMALWTYLCLPYALALPGTVLAELPGGAHERLAVRLPDTFVSHCREQVIHVDRDGLIRRHDYTAQAFGKWARASQMLSRYRCLDGVVVATRRRVFPRIGDRPLPVPRLVRVDVRSLALA
jgi:hypothetical protein